MKDGRTRQISDGVFGFVIQHCQKNRGATKELRERVSKAIGDPIARQQLESYLHPDEAKRIEPRFGIGLVLLTEARAMILGGAGQLDLRKTLRKANNGKGH